MTSRQLRLTANDLMSTPLYRASVGFERLFNELFDNPAYTANNTGYPPYNLARVLDSEGNVVNYIITLAVAGFQENDIDIVVENNNLTISGSCAPLNDSDLEVDYLHQGIAERNFKRVFRLADYVEVQHAELRDGILTVTLEQLVPEELKPKRIEINR
jgi:molecular chaperone IbpA